MSYKTDVNTDIGTKKEVNQDSLLVKQGKTAAGDVVCVACLCDGMGGLSQGEMASSSFVRRIDEWFRNELPGALSKEEKTEELSANDMDNKSLKQVQIQLNLIVQQMNEKLKEYGRTQGFRIGTTVVMMVIVNDEYLVMNVGDSRAYVFTNSQIGLLTHDHSYVQQQMDLGKMTYEEAVNSDKKSILLQCIGASEEVKPDFYTGFCSKGENYLLCSDGLWRKLDPNEIVKFAAQRDGLKKLTELVKNRGETDNISGLLISI